MSIDYSDMAFPKVTKKKKRKKHKKSIVKSQKGLCYLCALEGNNRQQYTEEHHVIFGQGRRAKSEEEGLKVDLCLCHHRVGEKAVHNNKEMRYLLNATLQTEYEKTHTRKEWLSKFYKNYRKE